MSSSVSLILLLRLKIISRSGIQSPSPFIWTATVESIIEKLTHCKQTLEKIQPGCTLPRSVKENKITPVVYETLH